MRYQRQKEKMAKGNLLGDFDTLGAFDYATFIITLDALNRGHIQAIDNLSEIFQQGPNRIVQEFDIEAYHSIANAIPIVIHELTHFVDATSTLWGLNHLRLMLRAYKSSPDKGGSEDKFHHAKRFHDHMRSLRLPEYYSGVLEPDAKKPWRWQPSVGRIFNSDGKISDLPILFSRFSTEHGKLIARSPVSIVALFEASAMSQEVKVTETYLSMLGFRNRDAFTVEKAQLASNLLSRIYNANLTEYSVCAHMAANLLGISDVLTALSLAGVVSRAVLNCTKPVFTELSESANLGEILAVPEQGPLLAEVKKGLSAGNHGILFYVLCAAWPESKQGEPINYSGGMEAAFDRLGCTLDNYTNSLGESVAQAASELERSSFRSIGLLGEAGFRNWEQLQGFPDILPFTELALPEMYAGDDTRVRWGTKGKSILDDISVDDCFDELFEGEQWVKQFSEACL